MENPETVQSTVVDLGTGKVTTYSLGNLTVLAMSGVFSQRLLAEFEDRAKRGGSLGVDLSGLSGVSPALIPSLEKLRTRLERRGQGLVLLNPPARLLELLHLMGLTAKYDVEEVKPGQPEAAEERARVARFGFALQQTQEIERHLENAEHRISAFMPQALPSFPPWRFAAYWRPCDRIGGDFYDFIPLDETRLGIALGDVSGHGLPAAVIMGMAKKVLRIRAQDMPSASPCAVLGRVNRDLRGELRGGVFVTMLYGVLDTGRSEFLFARAGHEPPIWVPAPPAMPRPAASRGMAVGLVDDATFESTLDEGRQALMPGETVVLTSDGVCDAADRRGVRFGRDRVREALAGQSAGTAIRALFESISSFCNGTAQNDDIAAVAFGRERE